MKTISRLILCSAAAISACFLQSCLKEKECPRTPSVFVTVQDKNYDNAAETGQIVDENLPLRQYVGSMDVSYIAVGNTTPSLRESVKPSGNDKAKALSTSPLAPGSYTFYLIGRPSSSAASGNAEQLVELHPQQAESDDVYVGAATIALPLSEDHTILLHRAKGKLTVSFTNLPPNIARAEIRVAGVYKDTDTELNYSGTTGVTKSFPISAVTDPLPLEMLLAPTDASGSTSVMILLYDDANNPVEILSNLALNISRNHVTQLNASYDPDATKWIIWIMVEGEWRQLHPLVIN